MKKVIDFNSKFSIGTIVYGVLSGKIVKGKIVAIEYNLKENILKEPKKEIQYGICILSKEKPLPNNIVDFFTSNDSFWFETITEVKNYLSTQIKNTENEENNRI